VLLFSYGQGIVMPNMLLIMVVGHFIKKKTDSLLVVSTKNLRLKAKLIEGKAD